MKDQHLLQWLVQDILLVYYCVLSFYTPIPFLFYILYLFTTTTNYLYKFCLFSHGLLSPWSIKVYWCFLLCIQPYTCKCVSLCLTCRLFICLKNQSVAPVWKGLFWCICLYLTHRQSQEGSSSPAAVGSVNWTLEGDIGPIITFLA